MGSWTVVYKKKECFLLSPGLWNTYFTKPPNLKVFVEILCKICRSVWKNRKLFSQFAISFHPKSVCIFGNRVHICYRLHFDYMHKHDWHKKMCRRAGRRATNDKQAAKIHRFASACSSLLCKYEWIIERETELVHVIMRCWVGLNLRVFWKQLEKKVKENTNWSLCTCFTRFTHGISY